MNTSQLKFRQKADAELVSAGAGDNDLKLKGRYIVEHWRGGKRINSYAFKNGITNEGKNSLLDVMFDGATQITTWWMGLIDLVNYVTLADDDTYDDINQSGNQWDEFTDYTDSVNSDNASTRPVWDTDSASAQAITNSVVAVYKMTAAGDVKGIFGVGGAPAAQTKGDHAPGPKLWATALFAADVPVVLNDELKVTYTVSA